jgi:hypothetical protein
LGKQVLSYVYYVAGNEKNQRHHAGRFPSVFLLIEDGCMDAIDA